MTDAFRVQRFSSVYTVLIKCCLCLAIPLVILFHAFVIVCRLFFSKLTFTKNTLRNTIRVSNGLNPTLSVLIWVQTVFKGYKCISRLQKSPLARKELERLGYKKNVVDGHTGGKTLVPTIEYLMASSVLIRICS